MDKQNLECLYNGISFSHKKSWSTDAYTIWMNLKNIILSKISQAQRLYTMIPFIWNILSSVQSLSRVQLFATPWNAARQASLSITNSQNLLKLMSIESVMPSNHLILCRPLLFPPSIFPSIRVFSNSSVLRIKWPKYWSFCFSINPSDEYSGLISFRTDWFELLAVQRTLKSLLQHHSSKASILWHSVLYSPALTSIHDYWKNCSFD